MLIQISGDCLSQITNSYLRMLRTQLTLRGSSGVCEITAGWGCTQSSVIDTAKPRSRDCHSIIWTVSVSDCERTVLMSFSTSVSMPLPKHVQVTTRALTNSATSSDPAGNESVRREGDEVQRAGEADATHQHSGWDSGEESYAELPANVTGYPRDGVSYDMMSLW